MNKPSKFRFRKSLIALLAFSAIILAGCSGSLFTDTSWPGVSVDEDNAYLAFNQFIYSIDLTSGTERWRFPREPERGATFFAPPLPTEDGLLIAGGFDGVVYALDIETGVVRWSFEEAGDIIVGAPVISDELVLVPSANGVLFALEITTGKLVWQFDEAREALWSSPLVTEESIFLSSMDHHIYALNPANGKLLWEKDIGEAIVDTPFLQDDTLLIGTFGNQVLALDMRGTELWSFETQDWVWAAPSVKDDFALFGDIAGNLYSASLNRGIQKWTTQLDGPVTASPLFNGEFAYFLTGSGTIFARDASNNTPKWEVLLSGGLYSTPIVHGDLLLVGVTDPETPLVALRAETGNRIWSFTPRQ